MIADIRQRLEARPFEPFTIITTGGNRYPVPTREHASINPQNNRAVIWFDDGGGVDVAGLHICALEKGAWPKRRARGGKKAA